MTTLLSPRKLIPPLPFKCALGACHVPCIALGRGDTKIDISCPPKPTEKTNNNQIREYCLIRVTTEGNKECVRLTGGREEKGV